MTVKTTTAPRQLKPELEHDFVRSPDLGYELSSDVGFVRCLSHGFPTPLARWHYHDEYELHLITSTSGKVFVLATGSAPSRPASWCSPARACRTTGSRWTCPKAAWRCATW